MRKIKWRKSAFKAWSTWGLGVLTLVAFFHAEIMPLLYQFMDHDDYIYAMGIVTIIVTVLRFIDQELRGDDD